MMRSSIAAVNAVLSAKVSSYCPNDRFEIKRLRACRVCCSACLSCATKQPGTVSTTEQSNGGGGFSTSQAGGCHLLVHWSGGGCGDGALPRE